LGANGGREDLPPLTFGIGCGKLYSELREG